MSIIQEMKNKAQQQSPIAQIAQIAQTTLQLENLQAQQAQQMQSMKELANVLKSSVKIAIRPKKYKKRYKKNLMNALKMNEKLRWEAYIYLRDSIKSIENFNDNIILNNEQREHLSSFIKDLRFFNKELNDTIEKEREYLNKLGNNFEFFCHKSFIKFHLRVMEQEQQEQQEQMLNKTEKSDEDFEDIFKDVFKD